MTDNKSVMVVMKVGPLEGEREADGAGPDLSALAPDLADPAFALPLVLHLLPQETLHGVELEGREADDVFGLDVEVGVACVLKVVRALVDFERPLQVFWAYVHDLGPE